jgi:hypothetical protein
MAELQIYEQKDFSGGLNLRSDQFQLGENESPQMLNIEIDPRGGIFSRGGMRRINGTDISGTWTPQKLYPFYCGDPDKVLLTTKTNVLWSTGDNFTVLSYASGSPVLANSSHGPCVAVWGSKAYIATGAVGTTGAYSWDGSATYATAITRSGDSGGSSKWQDIADNTVSCVPQCEHLAVHANKMFAAWTKEPPASNVSTPFNAYPNRIRWSLEGTPTNWAYDDYIDITGGGEGITGMVTVQGQLVIFKPRAVYVLTGYDSDTFQVTEISGHVGCSDHTAMAASESGVYFWSKTHGLYYYDGSQIRDLFSPLRPLLDLNKISVTDAGYDAITVSWIGKRVWVSIAMNAAQNPNVATYNYVFDPQLGSWVQFQTADGYGVIGGCGFITSTHDELSLMVHPVKPIVVTVDDYETPYDVLSSDIAVDEFNSYYRTKWFDAGSYLQRKMFRRPDFVVKESQDSQEITVSAYHDFDETNSKREFVISQPSVVGMQWGVGLWGTGVWGSQAQSSQIATGRNLGLAKTIQLKFDGPKGKEWGINSIGYKFVPKRVKG